MANKRTSAQARRFLADAEAFTRRSDAARKGWETRRERERQAAERTERRSEAARKGWATRRERAAERAAARQEDFIEYDDSDYYEIEIGLSYFGE